MDWWWWPPQIKVGGCEFRSEPSECTGRTDGSICLKIIHLSSEFAAKATFLPQTKGAVGRRLWYGIVTRHMVELLFLSF